MKPMAEGCNDKRGLPMIDLLDAYAAHFKAYIALQLQYRAELVIWLLGMVLEPVIYLVVWSSVARSSGGQVGGFTPAGFAAYYILFTLVNHATFSWIMHEFEFRIRNGDFSPRLLRPIHPIHSDIADNLTYKLLTSAVMLPAAIVLSLVFQPSFAPPLWAIPLFVPALALGFLVRFFFEWVLALAAFWTTRVAAINQMYFAALLFFSGRMAPLALLPAPIQAAGNVLPFRWMISFPVELLLGRLSPSAALAGLGIQLLWLLAALAVLHLGWQQALRRYTAVGA